MNKPRTAAIAFAICCSIACEREPADFNDCILHTVKSGMSERAVQVVTRACREKFPEEEDHPNKALARLPDEARNKLTGHFGPQIGSTWGGNIYNANEDWTVEEVTLLITPQNNMFDQTTDMGDMIAEQPERYWVSIRVPPLSSSEFSISVNWNASQAFDWTIAAAKGIKSP